MKLSYIDRNFCKKNLRECLESNPEQLGEKRERYLCALPLKHHAFKWGFSVQKNQFPTKVELCVRFSFQRHQPDLVQRHVRQIPESLPDFPGLLRREAEKPVRLQRRAAPGRQVHRRAANHLLQVRVQSHLLRHAHSSLLYYSTSKNFGTVVALMPLDRKDMGLESSHRVLGINFTFLCKA